MNQSSNSPWLQLMRKEVAVFLKVAETESFSSAASDLSIHQPAISKSLKRLETELQTTLFSRGRDGIKLTEGGLALQATLQKVNDLWKTETKNEKIRHLTLACHQSVAIDFFPSFVTDIGKLFPQTELSFQLLTSLQVTEKVSQLEIDIGIVVNPVKRRQIIAKPIREDFVSCWSKGGPENKSTPILVHPDMLYASRMKSASADVLQVPDYEVISSMVKKGNFNGILPASVAIRHGLKQIDKKLFTVDVSLIFHEDRFDRETARKLLKMLE